MAAKFEIRQPKAGEFRWVLLSQGRTLATSEAYSGRGAAEKAIEAFRKGAATATIDDTTAKPVAKAGRAGGKAAAATKKTAKSASTRTAKGAAEPTASSWGREVGAEGTAKKAAKAVEPARTGKKAAAPGSGPPAPASWEIRRSGGVR
jgi:uncharacterized protein YegP (UPF0339 family)